MLRLSLRETELFRNKRGGYDLRKRDSSGSSVSGLIMIIMLVVIYSNYIEKLSKK